MNRGEIRLYRFGRPDKERPVLVLTRTSAVGFLNTVTVAPVTRTRRGVRSEVAIGPEHGMKADCAINFHNVVTVSQRDVGRLVCTLPEDVMGACCRALAFALGCDEAALP